MRTQQIFLQSYYVAMSRSASTAFKNEVLGTFGWSRTTFYRKLNTGKFITPVEEREFIRIMNHYLPNENQL